MMWPSYLSVFILIFYTQRGDSALTLAALHGLTNAVVELVKAGANLDLKNNVHNLITIFPINL